MSEIIVLEDVAGIVLVLHDAVVGGWGAHLYLVSGRRIQVIGISWKVLTVVVDAHGGGADAV